MKRINLILLFLVLSFGIEKNYCSESNLAQNGQNIEPQAQAVEVRGGFIGNYIFYEGFTNILYWLFDWYQKKPGWYWYKHYRSFGYRTRLFSNRFYFDFYMRTWINILVALNVLVYYRAMKSVSSSPEYGEDISEQKKYDSLSNMMKICLCFMFVPAVDLNIRFGDKFYLVIGFRDIIISYFSAKLPPLSQQIMLIQAVSNRAS